MRESYFKERGYQFSRGPIVSKIKEPPSADVVLENFENPFFQPPDWLKEGVRRRNIGGIDTSELISKEEILSELFKGKRDSLSDWLRLISLQDTHFLADRTLSEELLKALPKLIEIDEIIQKFKLSIVGDKKVGVAGTSPAEVKKQVNEIIRLIGDFSERITTKDGDLLMDITKLKSIRDDLAKMLKSPNNIKEIQKTVGKARAIAENYRDKIIPSELLDGLFFKAGKHLDDIYDKDLRDVIDFEKIDLGKNFETGSASKSLSKDQHDLYQVQGESDKITFSQVLDFLELHLEKDIEFFKKYKGEVTPSAFKFLMNFPEFLDYFDQHILFGIKNGDLDPVHFNREKFWNYAVAKEAEVQKIKKAETKQIALGKHAEREIDQIVAERGQIHKLSDAVLLHETRKGLPEKIAKMRHPKLLDLIFALQKTYNIQNAVVRNLEKNIRRGNASMSHEELFDILVSPVLEASKVWSKSKNNIKADVLKRISPYASKSINIHKRRAVQQLTKINESKKRAEKRALRPKYFLFGQEIFFKGKSLDIPKDLLERLKKEKGSATVAKMIAIGSSLLVMFNLAEILKADIKENPEEVIEAFDEANERFDSFISEEDLEEFSLTMQELAS